MTGVRVRREPFGAIVYVPRRDHFFALDRPHTDLLLGARKPKDAEDLERLRRLDQLDDGPRAVDGRARHPVARPYLGVHASRHGRRPGRPRRPARHRA